MSLFRSSRSSSRAITKADFWGEWAEGNVDLTVNGIHIGTKSALQLSIVKGATRLLAGSLMGLPWVAYRKPQEGPSVEVRSPLLERPSATLLPSAFKWQNVVSLLIWGNATNLVVGRDAAGNPQKLEPLDPDALTHTVTGGEVRWFFNGNELPADRVLNIPFGTMPGQLVGVPPLRSQGYVELAAYAQQFGLDWFKDGAHPSGVLYSDDRNMDREKASIVKRGFVSAMGRSREPAVIGAGLRYEQIQVAANESQFLETLRQAQVDICMVFGVQPEQLGISGGGSSVTYANRESRVQEFLTFGGLNPLIVTLQEAMSDQLPNGQVMRINTGALLRSDTRTRYESYKIGKEIGLFDTDDIRELEDRPPTTESEPTDV